MLGGRGVGLGSGRMLGAKGGSQVAVKKVKPKKPAARAKRAGGSKTASKLSGRKTGSRKVRKSGRKTMMKR